MGCVVVDDRGRVCRLVCCWCRCIVFVVCGGFVLCVLC